MLNNPEKTARLLAALKAAVPFKVELVPSHRHAAVQRYLQRKIDLHNASHIDHNSTPSLGKLRALADGACEDRKQRMANAWRN